MSARPLASDLPKCARRAAYPGASGSTSSLRLRNAAARGALLLIGASLVLFAGCSDKRKPRIEIVHEQFISRSGTAEALVRSDDGGYLVVGSDHAGAWGLRLDAKLRPVWTHLVPGPRGGSGAPASFNDAVMLHDGVVILCGAQKFKSKKGGAAEYRGLLSAVDPAGVALRTVTMPRRSAPNHSSAFDHCIANAGGVLAVGRMTNGPASLAMRYPGDWIWLVQFSRNLDVEWESALPKTSPAVRIRRLIPLPHDEILLVDGDGLALRLTRDGSFRSQGHVDLPVEVASSSRMPLRSVPPHGETSVEELDSSLARTAERAGISDGMFRVRAFGLADGRIAVFGSRDEIPGARFPAIGIYDPETGSATVTSLSRSPDDTSKLEFVAPTNGSGEFAIVRRVSALGPGRLPDADQSGLLLSIVRLR